ncbi:DUF4153 domain-containing protein [Mucilaginibacter auburnensis]|uniref:Uncharacterized protein DUF4153 n=1 Tax=Mucilaginibacter auburnensis TaxID=1457233 RepID=A0A2H9VRM8_9SPHI|nr:DUF4153 domain-containing protein [Mucilaginibacter auburnensis]PJJ83474.1 uncharacterized protein DUF4153 [Mucilaginibacter auburnensis]
MKFPSIKALTEGFKNTIKLYPLEVVFALMGTIAATINVELDNIKPVAESWCMRIIMTANLGLLLSLAVTLFTRSRQISAGKANLFRLGAILIAACCCLLINPYYRQSDYIRFLLLSLSFHLLVAYAAFTVKGNIQGFWQFNKTLFLRILTSALYSAVLFVGLAAAMGALNFLFNFKFESDAFLILWIWIVGMFNTLFFLAGVPVDTAALDQDDSYPKGLKIFTQYVLVPLATVYVLILLAYEAKILLQWSLPKGYVSNIILGYAVFGILSLLLVYPIREREENKWLKTYAKSFYFLMLPLLGLLFVAVGTRVFKYGVTEERYFLIVLAVWLLFISVYFLLFKKQNIKVIPGSLSVLTLLSVYGPQSAFSVSQYSQTRILVNIFKKHGAFQNGKLQPITAKIDSVAGDEAVRKIEYLVSEHDLTSLQPYLKQDLQAVSDSISKKEKHDYYLSRYILKRRKTDWAIQHLGLSSYTNLYFDKPTTTNYYYTFTPDDQVFDIKGFDYIVPKLEADSATVKDHNLTFKRNVRQNGRIMELLIDGELYSFNIETIAKTLIETELDQNAGHNNIRKVKDEMVLTKAGKKFYVKLFIKSISFSVNKKAIDGDITVEGNYLIKELR